MGKAINESIKHDFDSLSNHCPAGNGRENSYLNSAVDLHSLFGYFTLTWANCHTLALFSATDFGGFISLHKKYSTKSYGWPIVHIDNWIFNDRKGWPQLFVKGSIKLPSWRLLEFLIIAFCKQSWQFRWHLKPLFYWQVFPSECIPPISFEVLN